MTKEELLALRALLDKLSTELSECGLSYEEWLVSRGEDDVVIGDIYCEISDLCQYMDGDTRWTECEIISPKNY